MGIVYRFIWRAANWLHFHRPDLPFQHHVADHLPAEQWHLWLEGCRATHGWRQALQVPATVTPLQTNGL